MISGYYGFGNIGDEAILTSIVDSIREINPETTFTVLSSNPEVTAAVLNVNSINRLNLLTITSELLSTDLFISGGGGLMQDVTGLGSVSYYGGLLSIAQMLNVPTMIFAQGIGPLNKAFNKFLVKKIFNKATAITIRDSFSRNDLISMGVKPGKIQVTADPALLLAGTDKKHSVNILMEAGIDPEIPIIGIAIRPWHAWYERQLKGFTSVVYQLAKKYGLQILLIPFQLSSDLWLSREAEFCFAARPWSGVKISVLDMYLSPTEMMGIIGEMHIVIGMRLHSLIMAAAHHIPSVGIAYDPKVAHFSSLAGFPCIPSVTDLQNINNVLAIVEEILTDRDIYCKKLSETVPVLTELALDNVLTAFNILNSRRKPN
jgi:polysaccharide pyruvyl transferase CsaB